MAAGRIGPTVPSSPLLFRRWIRLQARPPKAKRPTQQIFSPLTLRAATRLRDELQQRLLPPASGAALPSSKTSTRSRDLPDLCEPSCCGEEEAGTQPTRVAGGGVPMLVRSRRSPPLWPASFEAPTAGSSHRRPPHGREEEAARREEGGGAGEGMAGGAGHPAAAMEARGEGRRREASASGRG